jgi:hypothetical protein
MVFCAHAGRCTFRPVRSSMEVNDMAKSKKKKAKKAAKAVKAKKAAVKKAPAKKTTAKKTTAKPAGKKKAKKVVKAAAKKVAKRAAPKKVAAKKPAPKARKQKTVGEGDYEASRAFLKDQAGFVKKNRAEIPAMGKQAEMSLEGPEGDALRAAEAEAASHSKAAE